MEKISGPLFSLLVHHARSSAPSTNATAPSSPSMPSSAPLNTPNSPLPLHGCRARLYLNVRLSPPPAPGTKHPPPTQDTPSFCAAAATQIGQPVNITMHSHGKAIDNDENTQLTFTTHRATTRLMPCSEADPSDTPPKVPACEAPGAAFRPLLQARHYRHPSTRLSVGISC